MSGAPGEEVSAILEAISEGDPAATERLLPIVYDELRRMARAAMANERPGQTLQPTALVHEAYLRLLGGATPGWRSRGHFFSAAAEAMRRILIERARRYGRLKRGENPARVELSDEIATYEPPAEEVLALDAALERLEQLDPMMGRVVKLRFFAGLTVDETAEVLDTSPRNVDRVWSESRAWLIREMNRGRRPGA